tara:strand:+ start:1093 stop:1317 length:225 start_codon:yes stop_codon:yes gene_type:complete
MPIDKNNLDLEFVDDLTMKVIEAEFGVDAFYVDCHTGDQLLTSKAEDAYMRVSEDIEDRLKKYLAMREIAPDAP